MATAISRAAAKLRCGWPSEACLFSARFGSVLLTALENGAAIETANVGREGAFGLFAAMYSLYTHEFFSHILSAKRKSVTLAAQSMQSAGLISYRRGTIQVLDRAGLKKASCECDAIAKERVVAFLIPLSTAVQGHNEDRTNSKKTENA
jgi:hypothetical protein